MRKGRQFLSLPVVSLEEGKEIGRIRGLVINPQTVEVAALLVQRSGFFSEQKVIPYPHVVSVGNNALTIQKIGSAEKLTSLPQILNLVKEQVKLRGARVITEGGTALGYVEEFLVDPDTGKITAFEVGGRFGEGLLKGRGVLPAQEVRTIGQDILVVRNGAEAALTRGEGKLTETVKSLKESTTRLVQKTRQLQNHSLKEEEISPRDLQTPARDNEQGSRPETGVKPETPAPQEQVTNKEGPIN
ncbi:MAG: PRC-barrel domain-containing protein [Bacillota bacterium]|nr:PRC-barrel domain-containing protein [Bacillota bacterium]